MANRCAQCGAREELTVECSTCRGAGAQAALEAACQRVREYATGRGITASTAQPGVAIGISVAGILAAIMGEGPECRACGAPPHDGRCEEGG